MGLGTILDEKGVIKPEAGEPAWEEIAENEKQTRMLEEKLTVKRGRISILMDIIRDISLVDIWKCRKAIGIAAGAAALMYALVKYDANTRTIINAADSIKPETAVEYNYSLLSEHRQAIRKASVAAGVDARVLEAVLYAVDRNPEYVASARAGGRRGVIPLDSVDAGIRPELLETDPELCITAAAEMYRDLRQRVRTDTEAMAALLSTWDDFQKAVATARRSYIERHSSLSGSSNFWEEELANHEHTLYLLEKHKKGELTGFDYYLALARGTRRGRCYYEGFDEEYKKEFEDSISEPPQNPMYYVINPKYNLGIKVLRDDYLRRVKQIITAFNDFTVHLPEPAAEAVDSARDYLNSDK